MRTLTIFAYATRGMLAWRRFSMVMFMGTWVMTQSYACAHVYTFLHRGKTVNGKTINAYVKGAHRAHIKKPDTSVRELRVRANNLGAQIAALLPARAQRVQLMELSSRLATVDLQQHVTNVGGSPEALKVVMASVARGVSPAYDKRLGISREDFGRYIAFQPMFLDTRRSIKLPCRRSRHRLNIGVVQGAGSVLSGLAFDFKTGELRVPEGFVAQAEPIQVNMQLSEDDEDNKDRIHIERGYQWNLAAYDPESQNGIKGQLNLYLLKGEQVVLTYKRFNMLKGRTNEGEVIIRYRLPKGE